MSVDYGAIADQASTAIANVGMGATLIGPAPVTGGSESNPTYGAPEETPCVVVQSSLVKLRKAGSLVEGAEGAYLVGTRGLSEAPNTGYKLRVLGVDYRILDVSALAPAGVDLIYTVQVSK